MEIGLLIDQLADDGPRLAAAAERAGWDAPVPRTRWTVRKLVTHTGGVHRWAADVVGVGSKTLNTEAGRAVGIGPGDDELLDWFLSGHAALVSTLREAPPDLVADTFLPAPSPLHFWSRRQAHETAVHRADADAACGELTSFAPDFAQDGMSEMLTGFAARKSKAVDTEATILLEASDGPSWLVTLGGDQTLADVVGEGDPEDCRSKMVIDFSCGAPRRTSTCGCGIAIHARSSTDHSRSRTFGPRRCGSAGREVNPPAVAACRASQRSTRSGVEASSRPVSDSTRSSRLRRVLT